MVLSDLCFRQKQLERFRHRSTSGTRRRFKTGFHAELNNAYSQGLKRSNSLEWRLARPTAGGPTGAQLFDDQRNANLNENMMADGEMMNLQMQR
ncbi:hypothetical protein [Bradyrhizobium sp. USDA 377]